MKKWLAWILTLAMIIGILPVNTLNVSAETTGNNVEPQAEDDEYGITTLSVGDAVAYIRNQTTGTFTYYDTLIAAIKGAADGDTITLSRDITEEEIYDTETATNMSLGGGAGFPTYNNITISGGDTVKTIRGTRTGIASHLINIYSSNVTIKNITFENFDRGGLLWKESNTASTVTFDNVKVINNKFTNHAFCGKVNFTLKLINGSLIQDNVTTQEKKQIFDEHVQLVEEKEPFAKNTRTNETFGTLNEAVNSANTIKDDTIEILRDGSDADIKSDNGCASFPKDVTIDGKNHTIYSSVSGGHLLNLDNQKEITRFTLKNMTFVGLKRSGFIWNSLSAAITLENVVIRDSTFSDVCIGISRDNLETSLVLDGVTFTGNKGFSNFVDGRYKTTLKNETVITDNSAGINVSTAAKLYIDQSFCGTVQIGGITTDSTAFATVDENYSGTGKLINQADAGKAFVVDGTSLKWSGVLPLAQVGETTYSSLYSAVKSAESGSTVTILRDATIDELIANTDNKNQIVVDGNKSVTINGNHHKITTTTTNNNDHVFLLNTNSGLTIENMLFDGLNKNGLIYISENGANITLNGVTVKNFTLPVDGGKMIGHSDDTTTATVILRDTVIENNKSMAIVSNSLQDNITLKIYGATYIQGNLRNDNTTSGNVWLKTADKLTVGADFNGKVAINAVDNDDHNVCDAGNKFGTAESGLKKTDGLVNDRNVKLVAVLENNELKWKVKETAQIIKYDGTSVTRGTIYSTLSEAITAYTSADNINQVIQMISDTTEDTITLEKTVYLDLNGHTVKADFTSSNSSVLYGMDSSTNGYKTPEAGVGKIVGTVNCASTTTTTTAQKTASKEMHYLRIRNVDGSMEFHRFKVAINQVGFWLNRTKKQATMDYKCYIQGDATVLQNINGLGFSAAASENESNYVYREDVWDLVKTSIGNGGTGTSPVFFTTRIIDKTTEPKVDNYTKTFYGKAAVWFKNGVTFDGSVYDTSFLKVVCQTYQALEEDARERKVIEDFIKNINDSSLTNAWESMKGSTTI